MTAPPAIPLGNPDMHVVRPCGPVTQAQLETLAAYYNNLVVAENSLRSAAEIVAANIARGREPGPRHAALAEVELHGLAYRLLSLDFRAVYRLGPIPGPILPGRPPFPS